MKLFDFKAALMKPLQEKNAAAKIGFYFGIFVVLAAVIIGAAVIITLLAGGNRSAAQIVSLLVCCLVVLVIVPILFVQLSYQYEYISAAIEGRETKEIWKYDFTTLLKRFGKLFLMNLIYAIPVVLVSCVLNFALSMVTSVFGAAIGVTTSYDPSYYRSGAAAGGLVGGYLVIALISLCVSVIVGLVQLAYQVFVVTPATLRLIDTHTFARGLEFGQVWKFMQKNRNAFVKLFLINLAIAAVAVVFSILSMIPFLGVILACVLGIPLAIFGVYFQTFAYSTLIGDMYRKLAAK